MLAGEHKHEQLAEVETMPFDAVLIKGADMLHNLLSLEIGLNEAADPGLVWNRFNSPEEKQLWYLTCTLDAIRLRLGDHPMVTDPAAVVGRLRA